jgi:hypothetical protein
MSQLISKITFNGVEIPILTIPKGTVLFHYQKDDTNLATNFFGEEIEKSKYCLSPKRNTFFYPFPYIMDTNKYIWEDFKNEINPYYNTMLICTTTTDLKVVLMLKPSPFVRDNTKVRNNFTKNCDAYMVCGKPGINTDPCFTDEFISEFPEIVGFIGLEHADTNRFYKKFAQKRFKSFRKFIMLYRDAKWMGVPEIVLHPLRTRNQVEIVREVKSGFELDMILKQEKTLNFKPLQVFEHTPFETPDELSIYLDLAFSSKGYKEDSINQHLTIDRRTLFFCLYEETAPKDRKYLLNIFDNKRLYSFKKLNKETIFNVFRPENEFYISKHLDLE